MTYQLRSNTITFEAALRDLEAKNDKARARAAHALGDVVSPDERKRAVPALIKVLEDRRPEVRTEAALSLGDLETEAAVEPLVARFEDDVPAVRQAAVIALGRLGFSSSFGAVAKVLSKGPPDLRFQAATSLVEIDQDRARKPLLAALDDGDGEVIGAVALALGAIGESSAADRLAGLLEDWTRPATRFDIAYALADLGDPRGIAVLGEFVDHKDLAWDAVEALEKIARAVPDEAETAADPLVHIAAQRFAPPRIKLRAAAAILVMTNAKERIEAARATLLSGLSARKLEHAVWPCSSSARSAAKWALAPLRDLARRWGGRHLVDEIGDALERVNSR